MNLLKFPVEARLCWNRPIWGPEKASLSESGITLGESSLVEVVAIVFANRTSRKNGFDDFVREEWGKQDKGINVLEAPESLVAYRVINNISYFVANRNINLKANDTSTFYVYALSKDLDLNTAFLSVFKDIKRLLGKVGLNASILETNSVHIYQGDAEGVIDASGLYLDCRVEKERFTVLEKTRNWVFLVVWIALSIWAVINPEVEAYTKGRHFYFIMFFLLEAIRYFIRGYKLNVVDLASCLRPTTEAVPYATEKDEQALGNPEGEQ